MTEPNYYAEYYRISAERQAGTIDRAKDWGVYDEVFTTVNYMTGNLAAFTPTPDEIKRFFQEKGIPVENILLEEYVAAFRSLILEKIRFSVCDPSHMNCYANYAINYHRR